MKNNGQGGNTMKTTTSTVTPISENPKQPQPRQTAKEVIAANVKSLIEQLELDTAMRSPPISTR
jgi:hypothetical protein